MIKETIALLFSSPLFWLGHLVSRPMTWWNCCAWLYPIYHKLMSWSSDLEDWADLEIMWERER